jgi:DNA repair protein RecO (recombination protein O)
VLVSAEKASALVIRQVDFSETSRVVTLFTREYGKLGMMAKGARRLKGPFESSLDLLAELEVVFLRKSSGGLDLLTEARLARRFQPASGQLSHLYGGYLVAELLDSLTEPNDPHPDLYDAAVSTLRNLSGAGDFARILFRFELIVLREVGQLPALEACAGCGQPWPKSGKIAFKVSQGGFYCPPCQAEEGASQFVSASIPDELGRLLEAEPQPDAPPFSRQLVADMRGVLTACEAQLLGRKPKTLRFLPF